MSRPKPHRPGDDCPDCGGMLVPHCMGKPWPAACALVRCSNCGSFGDERRWRQGVSDAELNDDEE